MSITFRWSVLAAFIALTTTVMAIEKPSKEFQDLMKSNGAIVDISLGTVRSNVGAGVGQGGGASLRAHIRDKDYDGIAADAATLQANFTKIEAFWTGRKVADAIRFSQQGGKAAADLASAARAKDDTAVAAAANAVATTCRECHQAHRAVNLADGLFEIL